MNGITISDDQRSLHTEQVKKTEQKKMKTAARWMTLLSALLLVFAYFTPIWKIQLWAPQYPEGLKMQIWIDHLSGDIDIINGLNHYIGMAAIDENMFPELNFLGYILGGIILLGLVAFISNRVLLLKIFTAVLLIFAAAALIDMYVWGYKYGHKLDPHAAIKVENQSYQPPLIGYKQLLNFTAYSAADKGGVALFVATSTAILALFVQWYRRRKERLASTTVKTTTTTTAAAILLFLSSCGDPNLELNYNLDACDYCGMNLVDNRYGTLLVTKKGKVYRFDDISCMMNFKNEKKADGEIQKMMVTDFSRPGQLIEADKSFYLQNEELKSPMGGNIAAFQSKDSLDNYVRLLQGEQLSWSAINGKVFN